MMPQSVPLAGETPPLRAVVSAPTMRHKALRKAHGQLDEKLAAEMKRPRPDSARLQQLKRHKLRIKDELFALERRMANI